MVVKISNFMINDYPIMIWVVIWVILLYRFIDWTYTWKMMLAIIKTKLPISGYIVKQSNIVYFIRSFTILLDSWVLLLESLKTSSQVVPNLAYKRELIRVKNEVELWLTISKSIWLNSGYEESVYLNDLIPEDLAYVINTWEETWTLSTSLKKVWENYNSELKRYIWNLSSMVEPLIIVIIWAIVGTIVLAVMSPFFEIGKVAQQL
jgi:type IV pilus assembly protein PilC